MSEGRIVFTRGGVLRGIRRALPIIIASFPFGLVRGVLSEARVLSFVETVLIGVPVFGGTSQILVMEIWSDPAPWAAATLAIFVVNIRMTAMGAAAGARWRDPPHPPHDRAASAFARAKPGRPADRGRRCAAVRRSPRLGRCFP